MPVAQWLILVMGLSTITPDSGSGPNSSAHGDAGAMYVNGTGGLPSGGGFGPGSHLSQHAGGTGQGTAGGVGMDANDHSWTSGDYSAQVSSTATDNASDTPSTGNAHGPAGMRLPAGVHSFRPFCQRTHLRACSLLSGHL